MTCGNGLPLAAVLSPGQSHECKSFERVMAAVRPRYRRPMWVMGDKGYSYPTIRRWCEKRGVWDLIPQRSDQLRRDGPRVFSKKAYRGRNVVERCIGWLKQNRRLSTRYEKLATSFMGMFKLAFIDRYLRTLEPSDTA